MALQRARPVESWRFPWPYDCRNLTWWYPGACIHMKFCRRHVLCWCLRHVKQSWEWQNVCVTNQSHWTIMTHNHWKFLDKWGLYCSRPGLTICYAMTMRVILFWMILSLTVTTNLVFYSAARDSDRSNSSDCFAHAMVNVRSREFPKSVLQADTIIVSCGLANFERTSWSTHRRHEFWCFTKNWTQAQTTTSSLAVLKTTTLECGTVIQYGWSTAESSMILVATRVWGITLVEIRGLRSPPWNLRITMSCKDVCITECLDSSRGKTLWSWSAGADVIVLLSTLRCGRTRWLVTVDINTPFLCCTCLNWISGKYVCGKMFGLQGTVYQNFPDALRSHPCWVFTTWSRVRIWDWSLEAITIWELQWKSDRKQESCNSCGKLGTIRQGFARWRRSPFTNVEKTSDKCHIYACWNEPESWYPRRTCGATRKLSWQRSCTGQLSPNSRCHS